jgi:hypothetical protein
VIQYDHFDSSRSLRKSWGIVIKYSGRSSVAVVPHDCLERTQRYVDFFAARWLRYLIAEPSAME